jgi:hypothetical protein
MEDCDAEQCHAKKKEFNWKHLIIGISDSYEIYLRLNRVPVWTPSWGHAALFSTFVANYAFSRWLAP